MVCEGWLWCDLCGSLTVFFVVSVWKVTVICSMGSVICSMGSMICSMGSMICSMGSVICSMEQCRTTTQQTFGKVWGARQV